MQKNGLLECLSEICCRLPNTLAFRLTFWYTLVVIVLITAAFNASYFLLSKALKDSFEQELIDDIDEFQTVFKNSGLEGVKREIERDMIKTEEAEVIFFQLFDKDGIRFYSSDLSRWEFLPDSDDLVKQVISSKQFILALLRFREVSYRQV